MTHAPDWWTKEDAALFEAAPELLQRLKEARRAIASHTMGVGIANDGRSHWCVKQELLGNIDAVIAKVEGER